MEEYLTKKEFEEYERLKKKMKISIECLDPLVTVDTWDASSYKNAATFFTGNYLRLKPWLFYCKDTGLLYRIKEWM